MGRRFDSGGAVTVFILSLGTRGDLEIFLGLARALRGRGHRVIVGTSGFFASRVLAAGGEFRRVGGGVFDDLSAVLETLADEPDLTRRVRRYTGLWLQPQLDAFRRDATALLADADFFVSNLKVSVARERRILPNAFVTYDPPASDDELPRYCAHDEAGRVLELVAMNRRLVDPGSKWGEEHRFTGFWETGSGGEPSPELKRFLAAGAPPVAITLGSMIPARADRFTDVVTEALERCGRRGVLVSAWSGAPEARSASLLRVAETPYTELFARVSCVVHHGGCGTVSEVLRAGRPSIVIPQILPQLRFGERLLAEQLATAVFDLGLPSPASLAEAIERTDAEPVIQSARLWRERVLADPGVADAATAIEAHAEACGVGE